MTDTLDVDGMNLRADVTGMAAGTYTLADFDTVTGTPASTTVTGGTGTISVNTGAGTVTVTVS